MTWHDREKREAARRKKGSADVEEDDLPVINSTHRSNGARHLFPDNYKARKNTETS